MNCNIKQEFREIFFSNNDGTRTEGGCSHEKEVAPCHRRCQVYEQHPKPNDHALKTIYAGGFVTRKGKTHSQPNVPEFFDRKLVSFKFSSSIIQCQKCHCSHHVDASIQSKNLRPVLISAFQNLSRHINTTRSKYHSR